MYKGKVKFYNLKSKFGFITEEVTGLEYYFNIKNNLVYFQKDDKVSFELKDSKKGKEAYNVTKLN